MKNCKKKVIQVSVVTLPIPFYLPKQFQNVMLCFPCLTLPYQTSSDYNLNFLQLDFISAPYRNIAVSTTWPHYSWAHSYFALPYFWPWYKTAGQRWKKWFFVLFSQSFSIPFFKTLKTGPYLLVVIGGRERELSIKCTLYLHWNFKMCSKYCIAILLSNFPKFNHNLSNDDHFALKTSWTYFYHFHLQLCTFGTVHKL